VGLEQELLEKDSKGLEAPINLQAPVNEDESSEKPVSGQLPQGSKDDGLRIEMQDATPAAPRTIVTSEDGQNVVLQENEEGKAPLSRTGSALSVATSNPGTDEGFSTPKEQGNDLPEETPVVEEGHPDIEENTPEKQAEGENNEESTNTVSLNDDKAETAPEPIQPTPPPIPRRSANRLSRPATPAPLTLTEGSSTIEPSPLATELKDPTSENTQTAEISPATPTEAGAEQVTELRASTESTRKEAPPPLPARHPQTPANPSVQEARIEGEKSWMKDDSEAWEEKTWRTVLRLKEGMWKARVGVSDETD